MKKGVFITFEGNDGAGKTTIMKLVKEELESQGYEVVSTREPGGSAIAESIRNLILDVNNTNMDARCEALLYAASRRQHLVEIVLPALKENKIVLCDRFLDSSLAYQGFARQIGVQEVLEINKFAIDDTLPDRTIFLSVSVETGKKRMDSRGEKNRLDLEESDFHKRVRQGYQNLIETYPERIKVVSAEADVNTVFQNTLTEVLKVISLYE